METFGADFEAMENIANRFEALQVKAEQLLANLKQKVGESQANNWESDRADAFYRELNTDIFPALTRLSTAFGNAGNLLHSTNTYFQTIESELIHDFAVVSDSARNIRARHREDQSLQETESAFIEPPQVDPNWIDKILFTGLTVGIGLLVHKGATKVAEPKTREE